MKKRCVTMKKIIARDYLRTIRENYGTSYYCASTSGFAESDLANIEAGVEDDISVIANAFFLFSRRFGLNYYELMMREAKFQIEKNEPKPKPNNKVISFAELLKKTRKQEGLSLSKLADICCCSKFAVCNWENGEKLPDPDMLARICYALKVPDDFFDSVYKAERFQPRNPNKGGKKEIE